MIPALMPNIYRHGEVHWNVTVNKMRGLVLDMLHEMDPATFARVAASLTSHSAASDPLVHDTTSMQPPARPHHFGPPKVIRVYFFCEAPDSSRHESGRVQYPPW